MMADVEAALIAALIANAGVSALVANRVGPWGAQQSEAYPYIVLFEVSTAGAEHLAGPNTLEWPRFQLEAWGKTRMDVRTVCAAIRAALDNVTIPGAPTITPVFKDQGAMPPDPETRSFGHRQDYLVFYQR